MLRGFGGEARVIVAEANTREARVELDAYLAGRGYRMARTLGPNRFFAGDPRTAERLVAARVDIVTGRSEHPLGPAATHPQHTGKRICLG